MYRSLTFSLSLWLLSPALMAMGGTVSAQGFFELVMLDHQIPFDPSFHPGCTKEKGRLLGDYSSALLAEMVGGSKGALNCAPFDPQLSSFKPPKKGQTPTECTFEVSDAAGTSKKLVVRLSKNDRRIERRFIACQ